MKEKKQANKIETYRKYIETLPKKRMGSGVIIRDASKNIIMVKPSYKSILEIPGGVVEKNESPYEACKREVKEELGIDLVIGRMLCVDYNSPDDEKTESLMFIFYGGDITAETIENIKVDGKEILSYHFMSLKEIKDKTTDSLYSRIEQSIKAIDNGTTYYLENQFLV